MSQAINSGAINETSFPGSEEGVSLVQMIGTVQIVCTMTTVTLLLGAAATTQAKASVKAAVTTTKIGTQATTEAKAVPAEITAQRKTKVSAQTTTATAFVAQVSTVIKARLSAIQPATAATSVVSVNKAFRGAFGTCTAQASSPTAANYVYRSAVLPALANTTAIAVLERPIAASGAARCVGVGTITFRRGIAASTVATVASTASAYEKSRTGATATPSAVVPGVATNRKARLSVAIAPGAYATSITPSLKRRVAAYAQPTANGRSGIGFKLQANAATAARAIASSAAADYGIAMPAPAERLMFVQASERLMEVTA